MPVTEPPLKLMLWRQSGISGFIVSQNFLQIAGLKRHKKILRLTPCQQMNGKYAHSGCIALQVLSNPLMWIIIFSMIWRRLCKLLSYGAGFFLFDLGGMHTFFSLRILRILNASYALYTIKFWCGVNFFYQSGSSFYIMRLACVMQKSTGSASSLQSKWILVVKPPRLLPIFLDFPF